MDNRPIGIFDSGIGGLTIADGLIDLMPGESLIYFGDTQHLPYGDKSAKTVQRYSRGITAFLKANDCKAIVIACNTASALAYQVLKEEFPDIEIYNVIDPVAEEAALSAHQDIGVIATRATIRSKVYEDRIRELNPDIVTHSLATPLLVPMIEEGFHKKKLSHEIIDSYLSNPSLKPIQSLILGCTHYPLIKEEIKEYYEGKVKIIDSPGIVAKHVHEDLRSKDLLSDSEKATYSFYVSDLTETFAASANRFIHYDPLDLKEEKLWG